MRATKPDERVLILAPVGRDAAAIANLLKDQGFAADDCGVETWGQMLDKAGALLLTEEALDLPETANLIERLQAQPSWSELPLIILTHGGEPRLATVLDLAATSVGAVTLLERPLSSATLLRSVEVALRSRRRQYQVRDLIEEERRRQQELEEAKVAAENELVDRKRAEQSLTRLAKEQTVLYQFTDKLHRASSLDEMY